MTIVIQRYATVDECTQQLAELEALQEEKNPTLPAAPASPPRDKPACGQGQGPLDHPAQEGARDVWTEAEGSPQWVGHVRGVA